MWDPKCLAAALCFLTSNVLFVVDGVLNGSNAQAADADDGNVDQNIYDAANTYNKNEKFWTRQFQEWKDLDPVYVESRWVERGRQRPIEMSAALFGAMAWFWMMVPIVQSAWVLSRGGKRAVGAHVTLAGLAIFGSIIELLARLMMVGMTNASEWMAKDFNLDDWSETGGDGTGWRVLEMIHIVARGMLLWIDAFEALALLGIVLIMFYSLATEPKFKPKRIPSAVSENEDAAGGADPSGTLSSPPAIALAKFVKPTFTKRFARLGLFVGLLALADFVADVLTFVDPKSFGWMATATNLLLGGVFLPLWLLWLARQLPRATERFERGERRASAPSSAGGEELVALRGSEGEIS